jgi:hypothetical protein
LPRLGLTVEGDSQRPSHGPGVRQLCDSSESQFRVASQRIDRLSLGVDHDGSEMRPPAKNVDLDDPREAGAVLECIGGCDEVAPEAADVEWPRAGLDM